MPFVATLMRWPGPGGWVFAVPVVATVDGRSWSTSVWWDKQAGWLLAVPVRIRGAKDDGDDVEVEINLDPSRLS
jgi:hypothetical protein